MTDDLRSIVAKAVSDYPNGFYRKLLKHHPQINELPGRSFSEKCYLLIHGGEPAACKWCGGPSSLDNMIQGYRDFCSKRCVSNYAASKIKDKVNQKAKVEKMKATNLERYGVEVLTQLPEYWDRLKASHKEKHGVDHWMHRDAIKKKVISSTRKTLAEQYGPNVTNVMHIPEVKEKAVNSQRLYAQSQAFRDRLDKQRQFMVTDEYFKLYLPSEVVDDPHSILDGRHLIAIARDIGDKDGYMLRSLLRVKGIEYQYSIGAIIRNRNLDSFMILNDPSTLDKLYDECRNLESLSKRLNVDISTVVAFLRHHGLKVGGRSPSLSVSKFEVEVRDYIEDDNLVFNNRTEIYPQEIDILSRQHKVAIECNGVYWHGMYGREYHLKKNKAILLVGYIPLAVTDLDWYNPIKRRVCEAMIDRCFNRCTIVNALDADVVDISIDDAKEHFHLNSVYRMEGVRFKGLKINDCLIAVAGLVDNVLMSASFHPSYTVLHLMESLGVNEAFIPIDCGCDLLYNGKIVEVCEPTLVNEEYDYYDGGRVLVELNK